LTSRLPGLADITPADPPGFARQLGEALARIHATTTDRLAGLPRVFDRPGESTAALDGPAASLVSARWESLAIEPTALTHYDFWSGNTVWLNGILTGVVDWSGAALGPRSFDLGWCRLDLYLLFDQYIADCFLESYKRQAEPLALIRCWRNCGLPLARTPRWSRGSRTTATLAAPT
jgi:aminoglycoside phosphotransferase (APT) family kinase protein